MSYPTVCFQVEATLGLSIWLSSLVELGAILVWSFLFLFSCPPSSLFLNRADSERAVHTAYVSQLAKVVILPQDIEQRTHTHPPLLE